jgi:hypothetical protein
MTMTDRLLTVEQYGLTALQMRERGPQTVVHPPYQNWMCPGCDNKLCRGEI